LRNFKAPWCRWNFDLRVRHPGGPLIVLIDKTSVIRYKHIGKGAYQRTGSVIKQLLAEKS